MRSSTGAALVGTGIGAMCLNPTLRIRSHHRLLSSLQLIAHWRSVVKIVKRHERIRDKIIADLIKLDLLRCKPISQQRHTRPLASVSTRSLRVVEASTQTMNTEAV